VAASLPGDHRRTRRGLYGFEIQTVPGTLRGYRAWQVDRDWRFLGLHNTGLVSLSDSHYSWNPREPQRAECMLGGWDCDCGLRFCPCCKSRSHRSPAVGCSCGYYATYDPRSYRQHVGTFGTFVHGCIKAYGRISLGTRGFRAEYAQVEAVYGRSARAAARRYHVPWFRSQERMLEHFPPQDVTELLR
jgi:hypothetical protein